MNHPFLLNFKFFIITTSFITDYYWWRYCLDFGILSSFDWKSHRIHS